MASLREVLGVALGPGASVYIEGHLTYKGAPDNWKADTFAHNKGGRAQYVREPVGTVRELHLSDDPERNTVDRERRDEALGYYGAHIGMGQTLGEVVKAIDDPDAANSDPRSVFFAGSEAEEMAGQLMQVGHQFSHPALRAWYAELAPAEQAA